MASNGFLFVQNFRFTNTKVDQRLILNRITDNKIILVEMTCFIKSFKPFIKLTGDYNPYTNHFWNEISITYDFTTLNNFERKQIQIYLQVRTKSKCYSPHKNYWININLALSRPGLTYSKISICTI